MGRLKPGQMEPSDELHPVRARGRPPTQAPATLQDGRARNPVTTAARTGLLSTLQNSSPLSCINYQAGSHSVISIWLHLPVPSD